MESRKRTLDIENIQEDKVLLCMKEINHESDFKF